MQIRAMYDIIQETGFLFSTLPCATLHHGLNTIPPNSPSSNSSSLPRISCTSLIDVLAKVVSSPAGLNCIGDTYQPTHSSPTLQEWRSSPPHQHYPCPLVLLLSSIPSWLPLLYHSRSRPSLQSSMALREGVNSMTWLMGPHPAAF